MASSLSISNGGGSPQLLTTLARLFAQTFTRSNVPKAIGAYVLYLLFKYRNTAFGARPRPDIDGPRGFPMIGNTIEMMRRPRAKNYQLQTESHELHYGPFYTVSFPGVGRIINITEPEMVDFWAYEKGAYLRNTLGPMVGQGIFGADGEHWRWQRKLASHIFNVKSFRAYTSDVFCQETNTAIDYLSTVADTGKVIDLQNIFYLFTLDSFGEIAFGQSFGCLKDPEREVEFAAAFDRLNFALSYRIISPIWKLTDWWTGNGKAVEKDTKTVHDFAYNVIKKRREELAKGGHEYKDLMQLFMDGMDENGEPLSDEMLKDELINMILGRCRCTSSFFS
ncbi:hypothetical protein BGZ58_004563 [Dissophora ornata]|nr:hypothetical protein BGZ58_004563 [Dissophora ornata]